MRTTIMAMSVFALSFSSIAALATDKIEELNGVKLISSKENSIRKYSATMEKSFPVSMELIKNAVTNFSEKCNNSLKNKRKFTSEKVNCKYHNQHLIESLIIKDINRRKTLKGLSEYYLLARLVYNRGSFGYYELVQISEKINEHNQKIMTISLRMLSDNEVRQFTTPRFEKESAFDQSLSTFTLTEISSNETKLRYEYKVETNHWLLNKEVTVPQVFASISKSINELIQTVEEETFVKQRDLASKD